MAKMLVRDLTNAEQMALARLSQSPDFQVFVKIMDEACRLVAAEPIKLDPIDDKYEIKLAKLTLIARATNDFCASIRATVLTHVEAYMQREQEAQIEKANEEVSTTGSLHVEDEIESEQEVKRILGSLHVLSNEE